MNQQRSRRFRASKESSEKAVEVAKIRAKLQAEGAILPPPKDDGSHFDSNCITPVSSLKPLDTSNKFSPLYLIIGITFMFYCWYRDSFEGKI